MSVSVGDLAPDFTLVNQHGDHVTLSDLRGRKVVLVFYPHAFSGTCTKELCDLRDRRGEFDDDTVLLGISVDSKHSQAAFAVRDNLSFDLLADFWPHGAVAKAYGVFDESLGRAIRGSFVIDREGVIRWSVINPTTQARSTEDYRRALADIDLVASHS